MQRNFQRSPELSAMLSGATEQLAPIMGTENKMVNAPAVDVQKVDKVANADADKQVAALID